MSNPYLEKIAELSKAERTAYTSAAGISVAGAASDAYGAYKQSRIAKRQTSILKNGNDLAEKAESKGDPNRAIRHIDRAQKSFQKLSRASRQVAANRLFDRKVTAAAALASGAAGAVATLRREHSGSKK